MPLCNVQASLHDLLRTTFIPLVEMRLELPPQPLRVIANRTQLGIALLTPADATSELMAGGGMRGV